MSRPTSKSHGYSSWNSWNESLLRTTPPMRSAIFKMKASPRPTAPAGGVTMSPAIVASRNRLRSLAAARCSNVASATTMISAPGCSSAKAVTASSSCFRLGATRPSVARLDPSTTTRRRGALAGLTRRTAQEDRPVRRRARDHYRSPGSPTPRGRRARPPVRATGGASGDERRATHPCSRALLGARPPP